MTCGMLVLAAVTALLDGVWPAPAKVISADPEALIPSVYDRYRQTAKRACVADNWVAMTNRIETEAATKGGGSFIGGCVWLLETRMMVELGPAQGGRRAHRTKFVPMNLAAARHLRETYLDRGELKPALRKDQRALALALYLRLVEGKAAAKTLKALCRDVERRGVKMDGVFGGETILLDTLAQFGRVDVAYRQVLKDPRPSFRDWLWKSASGVSADSASAGYANVLVTPRSSRLLGSVRMECPTPRGKIVSAWRYEGERWIWDLELPKNSTASITLPGETVSHLRDGGKHHFELRDPVKER